jgi:hypothetical protein
MVDLCPHLVQAIRKECGGETGRVATPNEWLLRKKKGKGQRIAGRLLVREMKRESY